MDMELLTMEDALKIVPADVPKNMRETYAENFLYMTHNTGKLMLFAGDQKIEHMNDDFYGEGISLEDNKPEHLFKIADQSTIGVLATQYGLVINFARDYGDVPILLKANSKTGLLKTEQMDPYSRKLVDVKDIVKLKENSGLKIPAVGYTVYLGSKYENKMLREFSEIIRDAHENGMIVVGWFYPRGAGMPKSKENDPHIVAGAAGVAASLGADFVKLPYNNKVEAELFKEAIDAAGRTRVVFAGGSSDDPRRFLGRLYEQLKNGAMGNATGRNIHPKELDKAIRMCNAISALTIYESDVDAAMGIYDGEITLEELK